MEQKLKHFLCWPQYGHNVTLLLGDPAGSAGRSNVYDVGVLQEQSHLQVLGLEFEVNNILWQSIQVTQASLTWIV